MALTRSLVCTSGTELPRTVVVLGDMASGLQNDPNNYRKQMDLRNKLHEIHDRLKEIWQAFSEAPDSLTTVADQLRAQMERLSQLPYGPKTGQVLQMWSSGKVWRPKSMQLLHSIGRSRTELSIGLVSAS
jgi:hypothetical protein